MKRTASALLAALTAVVLTLLGGAPATAAPGWVPDEVGVTSPPEALLTEADRRFLGETGAVPGDVLPVAWLDDGSCGASLCPTVVGTGGRAITIPPGSVAVTPHGADAPTDESTYPRYGTLMTYDPSRDGLLGEGPYDRDPTAIGLTYVESPGAQGLVWVSDETVTDRRGAEWTRVAYGVTDAWVVAERLTEVAPSPEPTTALPLPDPTEPVEEPTSAPLVSTPQDVAPTDSAAARGDGSAPLTAGVVAGGVLIALLAVAFLWRRRDRMTAP